MTFFNFNTDFIIGMCQGTLFKVCLSSTQTSNSIFGLQKFVLVWKNKDFTEFKVHLIHRKQVPLLHNTVLILCNEGAGLVAVYVLDEKLENYFFTHSYLEACIFVNSSPENQHFENQLPAKQTKTNSADQDQTKED